MKFWSTVAVFAVLLTTAAGRCQTSNQGGAPESTAGAQVFTGPVTFKQPLPSVTARSTNGVLNAATFPGADIFSQAMAAFATCSNHSCTVRIPPGNYATSATLRMPSPGSLTTRMELDVDAGANIHYTGQGDALITPSYIASQINTVIHFEGTLTGNPAAKNGIHVPFSNHVAIYDANVTGFSGGNGIAVIGGVVVDLFNVQSTHNKVGLLLAGQPGQASANAVHMWGGSLADNAQHAFWSQHIPGPLTPNQNNSLDGVDFEGSPNAVQLDFDLGTSIMHGYFEGPGTYITAGTPDGLNGTGQISIVDNYFTDSAASPAIIQLNGITPGIRIEGNLAYQPGGKASPCFVNVHTGRWGSPQRIYYGENTVNLSEKVCSDGHAGYPVDLNSQTDDWTGAQPPSAKPEMTTSPTGPAHLPGYPHCDPGHPAGALWIATGQNQGGTMWVCAEDSNLSPPVRDGRRTWQLVK
jgi:hypothetical protein